MISIDTNVLLRYLLNDDELQARKASKLILGHYYVYVSDVVLAETVWTLTGKKYKLSPEDVDRTVTALFHEENIIFENPEVTWRALLDYRQHCVAGKEKIDFADMLIFNLGKAAATEYDLEFRGFYTFDLAAQKLSGALAP